jgi:hypothetical protein
LFPEAFGLMALVNMLMLGLAAISDVGLQPAIIRHARGDEQRFLDTAWTIQVIRGVILWGIGSALAIPMARFYNEPELVTIVPIATLSALLAGFTSTKIVTLTRHMRPGRVVTIEFKVTDEEVRRAIMQRAQQFPGQERQVVEFFKNNPNAQMELRMPIFEDKVVDFALELADVTDKPVSQEELFSRDDEDEHEHVHGPDCDHDHDHGHKHG